MITGFYPFGELFFEVKEENMSWVGYVVFMDHEMVS
jgi:hypothetical protein